MYLHGVFSGGVSDFPGIFYRFGCIVSVLSKSECNFAFILDLSSIFGDIRGMVCEGSGIGSTLPGYIWWECVEVSEILL